MTLKIIEKLVDVIDKHEWQLGLELFSSNSVLKPEAFKNLIQNTVLDIDGKKQVHLKINPDAQYVMWMECTCHKNRRLGQYCEHIAATLLYLNKYHQEFFDHLKFDNPFSRLPAPKKIRKNKEKEHLNNFKPVNGAQFKPQSILNYLDNSLHSISFLKRPSALKINIDLKTGDYGHYNLSLDDSALFVKNSANLDKIKNIPTYISSLTFIDTVVSRGIKITSTKDEEIKIEKIFALPLSEETESKTLKPPHVVEKLFNHFPKTKNSEEKSNFIIFNAKQFKRYVDKEYCFLADIGYAKLNLKNQKIEIWDKIPFTQTLKGDDSAIFLENELPKLRQNLNIFLDDTINNFKCETPDISNIEFAEDNDEANSWFKLDPKYKIGTSEISISKLLKEYKAKGKKYYKKEDKWIKLPEYLTSQEWEFDDQGENLKVDTLALLRLQSASGNFDNLVGSKEMLQKIRNRTDYTNTNPPELKNTKLNLRPYQDVGFKWLWWLYKNNLHGLLADEMGLGKTHQTMALLTAVLETAPKDHHARFLVICPTTVLDHWLDKINDFSLALKPVKYHGVKRSFDFAKEGKKNHTLITSYGILARDINTISKIKWDVVVLDEVHYIKNNKTITHKATKQLQCDTRIALSGTPMENRLIELKNIFDFLLPGYLGSENYFQNNFITPLQSEESINVEISLQKLIYPFKMRRTKSTVLKDLPNKIIDTKHCTLSSEQTKLYRDLLDQKAKPIITTLEDNSRKVSYLHIFAILSLLKQICNHPAMISDQKNWQKHESGKFEMLKEILYEALSSGHKIVIFSQYITMINIISAYLNKENISHVCLTGQTTKRGDIIKEFQENPKTNVFVGSLLAGGIGIDLTAASVVIHYDRWWNPSKENQATDRVHRIGQNKNVQVYKFITRGTIEEKIDEMIKNKQKVFDKFLEKDEDMFRNMSRNDLLRLLKS